MYENRFLVGKPYGKNSFKCYNICEELIIMSLRALLEEYYAEQGYDTNVVNNFYYDETNNFIKFQFKDNKI